MKRYWQLILTVLLATGLVLGGFGTVYAQEKEKETFVLEEIVVTAERRESTVQDTPISVSAWDNATIDDQAIGGFIDLQMRMPSTTFQTDRIYIRGVGRELNQLGTDPGVGLFFDGFYNSEQTALDDLFDVERIEAIRGPQGTLFGRNTLGGAINVLYVKPSREWSGQVKTRFGNYKARNFWAAFGGSLIGDKLMGRVVLTDFYYGGHQKNTYHDNYQGEFDGSAATVKLLFEPTDNFTMYLKYSISESDSRSSQGIQLDPYDTADENFWFDEIPGWPKGSYYRNPHWDNPNDNLPAQVNPSVEDPRKIYTNDQPVIDLEANQVDLTTTLEIGNVTVKHLTFYRDWDYYNITDWDYAASPTMKRTGEVLMDVYEWSQELQLMYGSEESKLSFIGGLFYFWEHRNQNFNLNYSGDDYWESIFPWPSPGWFAGFTPQADRDIYWYTAQIESTSRAIYGQVDYQLTDELNVSLGARYADDEKKGDELRFYQYYVDLGFPVFNADAGKFYYHGVPYELWSGYPLPATLGTPTDQHDGSWDVFLYKVAVDYKPSDDSLIYASTNRGYKSGGFVLGTIQEMSFEPEFITAYEVGWKQLWLNDRFRTITALWFYDYEDKQVSARLANETRVYNAAEAESYGFEFESEGYIMENLVATLTYSYMSAEFKEYIAFDQAEPLELTVAEMDRSGNTLTGSPEHKVAISGTYTIPTNIGDFSLYAIYFWQSEVYFRPFNTWRSRAKEWDRVDARLSWFSTDYKWRVGLYVKNIFETHGLYNITVGGPFEGFWRLAGVTPPMQCGIEISYKW